MNPSPEKMIPEMDRITISIMGCGEKGYVKNFGSRCQKGTNVFAAPVQSAGKIHLGQQWMISFFMTPYFACSRFRIQSGQKLLPHFEQLQCAGLVG